MEPDLERCAGCGHLLGSSQVCTECGRPIGDVDDWRTGTAERPSVRPTPPLPSAAPPPPPSTRPSDAGRVPPPSAPPPPARFPLFVDDVDPVDPVDPVDEVEAADVPPAPPIVPGLAPAPAAEVAPPPVPAAPAPEPTRVPPERAGRSRVLPWLVGVAALVLVALVGTLLLLPGGDDRAGTAVDDTTDAAADTDQQDEESAPPSDPPATAAPPPSATPTPTESSSAPTSVTRGITVTVPETAPPNQDVDGNLVRYEARNMVDEVPTTTWRMPGSGEGTEVVLELAGPTVVTQVGLVNGYAKTSGELDWYRGNRRLRAVEWVFDDGTVVPQALAQTRQLQAVPVDDVRTRTIRLRLLEVSRPGSGRSGRDFTAISDLSVLGVERGTRRQRD